MQGDLHGKVSGPAVAAACALSPSRFYHLFRNAMGISFGRFALRARLAFAAQHLLYTDHSIRRIADEAGFVDCSHLHRSFVRHYGCAPGEYRARHHSAVKLSAGPGTRARR